jgi:hypothetical protein
MLSAAGLRSGGADEATNWLTSWADGVGSDAYLEGPLGGLLDFSLLGACRIASFDEQSVVGAGCRFVEVR